MGFWPLRTYAEYVRKHAEDDDKYRLRISQFEPLESDNRMFLLDYYSMPLWMDTFDVSLDEDDRAFRHILHVYRSHVSQFMLQVRKQLDPIRKSLTGRALLKEIGDTGRFLAIMPYWRWLDGINASAAPKDFLLAEEAYNGNWTDATAKGVPRRNGRGEIMRDGLGRPRHRKGDQFSDRIYARHVGSRAHPQNRTRIKT